MIENFHCSLYIPDIIIPGFSRCGTTTLYNILIQHPKIRKCFKEPETLLNKHIKFIPLLRNNTKKLIIDGTDTYILNDMFYKYLKFWNMHRKKFIIMIRNPIDAFISYYLNFTIRNNDFPKKLNFLDNKLQETLYRFKYSVHLERCLNNCKKTMIINLENFDLSIVKKIWIFLNLQPIELNEIPHTNDFKTVQKEFWNREIDIPKYSYQEWEKIKNYYEEDIEYISKLVNIDNNKWLNKPNKKYFEI